MKQYDHQKIEKKWQKTWARKKTYATKDKSNAEKAYILDMFPYPSGEGLHVGHPKGYIATDIYSRFKRMNRKNVLHPMGWDAFGLPAENYAIKNKTHPRIQVAANIARYKEQLSIIGLDYDWSREINTIDPTYYKWTQWIFLKLYERGLAFQSFEPINWCPSCQTGLANEDLEDGKCERCGSVVEKRPMRQWVLKITDYADRLLADLDGLNWPNSVKESQRHWIGRSEGAEIDFGIKTHSKKTFVLLHGLEGTSVSGFFPWLKSELEKIGHTVHAPSLPNSVNPNVELQADFVLKHVPVDKDTILIGHSLGGAVALRIIEKASNVFPRVVFVDPVIAPVRVGEKQLGFEKNNNWNFDWKIIQKNLVDAVILSDKKAGGLPTQAHLLAEQINADVLTPEPQSTHFTGVSEPSVLQSCVDSITVFTTRPETLLGVTYVVLAPEHGLVQKIRTQISNWKDVEAYITAATQKTDIDRTAENKDKTGVELAGIRAVNPATGEEVPVWIADYVLASYGTGAVMAVPAHDERDGQFAAKYQLPVVQKPNAIANDLQKAGARTVTKYKLRDWVFSRQRYWGEPIPLIHCEKCGVVPVPEKDLPVQLPDVKHYEPTGTGESPLAAISSWVNVKCPKCGGAGTRETNTMPQWAGSSWYYLRFMDPQNSRALVSPAREKYFAPVDLYVGGAEHATRHLIYARFWHKFLYDIGVVSTLEPFMRLHNVGLILAEDGRKMSKRYGNVVNPDEIVKTYGADTLRVYEMFMGPFDRAIAWDTRSIIGTRRFVERIWAIGERGTALLKARPLAASATSPLTSLLHKTIKKVTEDIEQFGFNTAISALMVLSHEIETSEHTTIDDVRIFLQLCAPFAPHITEELWLRLGPKKMLRSPHSIHRSAWPTYDIAHTEEQTATLVIQINGKVRDNMTVSRDATEAEVVAAALGRDIIKKWLNEKPVRKVIYVKGRILNLVI